MRPVVLAAAILLVGAIGCRRETVKEQVFTDVARRMQSVERFVGETRVRTAQGTAVVRVDIRNWTFGGGLKVDELPLQTRGLMIVQLRGGNLATVIDGQRQERREGEFWTVPAGARMGIETAGDSAVIQTIVIAQP
jgi:hypothetical protein